VHTSHPMRTIALLNRSKATVPKKVHWLKRNFLQHNDKIIIIALEEYTTTYIPAIHRCTWLPAIHRNTCTNTSVTYYKSLLKDLSNDKRLLVVRENECARVVEVLETYTIDVVVMGREFVDGDGKLFRMVCACMKMCVVMLPV
ncbi:hypothetical protein THOM_2166, partial [Trachipleistophora hominis]